MYEGLPRWHSGKESDCQGMRCRRCVFDSGINKILWSRKLQPTSVFLLGKFSGQKNLVGCSPWDHKELDMTEQLSMQAQVLPLAEWIAQFDFKSSDAAPNSSS